jgi:hypothetical protein
MVSSDLAGLRMWLMAVGCMNRHQRRVDRVSAWLLKFVRDPIRPALGGLPAQSVRAQEAAQFRALPADRASGKPSRRPMATRGGIPASRCGSALKMRSKEPNDSWGNGSILQVVRYEREQPT